MANIPLYVESSLKHLDQSFSNLWMVPNTKETEDVLT